MSGKLTFVNETIEKLFTNHEKLIQKFPYNGVMLTLECRILESGLTISAEKRSYLHTNPVISRVFVFHKGKARINTVEHVLHFVNQKTENFDHHGHISAFL